MSHFLTLVIADSEEQVEKLLAPYNENGEWFKDGSRWDWWQIGGRWTGCLDGYDPDKDPTNVEICNICDGTGKRKMEPQEGKKCNGCDGKGKRTVWPTRYKKYSGDVQPIGRILVDKIEQDPPVAIVTPDGTWHERGAMGFWGIPRGRSRKKMY